MTLQPRRARRAGCGGTHALLPTALSARRADTLKVIGTALAAKAAGSRYRIIASQLGQSLPTVRRRLRRVPETHARWLYEQAVHHAFRPNPEILVRPKRWPSLLDWSLNILAGAATGNRHREGPGLPPWNLIGPFTRGSLMSSPLRI